MSEELKQEEARQEMISQSRDHLGLALGMIENCEEKRTRLVGELSECAKELLVANEMRVTWLERIAGMMRLNVTRWMDGNDVVAVLADTDLDPVIDPDGSPVHVIKDFDDLTKLIISVKSKEGETEQ